MFVYDIIYKIDNKIILSQFSYLYRDLYFAWKEIEAWFNQFINPYIANRNPKIYIDDMGVYIDMYDDYDYPVECYSISILERSII